MDTNFTIDNFYFVSGFQKVYTGTQVVELVENNDTSYDRLCKITGIHDMLFHFRPDLFQFENRIYGEKRLKVVNTMGSIETLKRYIHRDGFVGPIKLCK